MLTKRCTLLIAFMVTASLLFAASVNMGLETGYSYTMVNTTITRDHTQIENSHGVEIGIPVEVDITPWFSVNSGLRYIIKSDRYIKTNNADLVIDDYIKDYHFLEIPLSLRFSFGGEHFRGFVGGGGYIGVRVNQFYRGMTALDIDNILTDRFNSEIPFTPEDNLFDGGVLAEAGIKYIVDRGNFYLLARYQYGLTSLVKAERGAIHTYFNNLSVTAGFLLRIGE